MLSEAGRHILICLFIYFRSLSQKSQSAIQLNYSLPENIPGTHHLFAKVRKSSFNARQSLGFAAIDPGL